MSFPPSPFQRKRNIELRQDQLSTDDLRKALETPAPPRDESDVDSHDIFKLELPSANDRYDPNAVLIPAPEPKSEPAAIAKPDVALESAAHEPAVPSLSTPSLSNPALSGPSRSAPALATPAPIIVEPAAPKPTMDLSRLSIDGNGHLYWDG